MDDASKLVKEIEKHLPIYFYPTPELQQAIRKQIKILNKDSELKVTKVFDSGDAGGIVCSIEYSSQVFVVSLTHLMVKQDHPLSDKILDYQRHRVNKLKNK